MLPPSRDSVPALRFCHLVRDLLRGAPEAGILRQLRELQADGFELDRRFSGFELDLTGGRVTLVDVALSPGVSLAALEFLLEAGGSLGYPSCPLLGGAEARIREVAPAAGVRRRIYAEWAPRALCLVGAARRARARWTPPRAAWAAAVLRAAGRAAGRAEKAPGSAPSGGPRPPPGGPPPDGPQPGGPRPPAPLPAPKEDGRLD